MPTEIDTLPHLRTLVELQRSVRTPDDVPGLFAEIARAISDALGFGTVAINVYRRAYDDFEVVTVHGSEAARDALLGQKTHWDSWERYLDERFLRCGAYLVRHDEMDWHDPTAHVPDLEVGPEPDAWHPEDALMVALRDEAGDLLGIISVDEPRNGLVPNDDKLDLLVTLVGHIGAAVEAAQRSLEAARDRAALGHLLAISSRLADLDTVDSVLDAVAQGIRDALGFEKVAIATAQPGQRFTPRGSAGWNPADPGLAFALTEADVQAIMVPAYEIEGCYLLPREDAIARISTGSSFASTRNGRGPHAWQRHWLLVPLHERDGTISGFIWADDPSDCLIPSPQRLQALRTFANQASAAIRSARDHTTLIRRNTELATLHRTALGLIEGLELGAVLETIVASACSLVGTPHGYLYLVDGDELELRIRLGAFETSGAVRIGRGTGISGRVWETGESLAVEEYDTWAGALPQYRQLPIHAVLGVPLGAAGEIRGVLGIAYDEEGHTFSPAEVALLERFAQLAALALQNARLYDDAQRQLEERRLAEEELRRSQELYRVVVESSADLITLLDLEGTVVFASSSHETILGYPRSELVGSAFHGFLHPDDVDDAAASFADTLSGAPRTHLVRARKKDGSWILIEGSPTVINDDQGRPELILAVSRDVTARRRDEEERERLEEQLRQAQKMESIGRLAGGIAHDFNNLLTAIGGYAELTLLDLEEGSARESVEQISRAATRAAELTSQLLAFSRKQVLRPTELDLNGVVTEMASMLARMLGERVVLSTELEPELGSVHADPTQVEQVILNLVDQRPRRHARGRQPLDPDGQPPARRRRACTPPRARPGLLRHALRPRRRRRHDRGGRGADLRAVLHDEERRRGHGPRARDRARDRQPERWRDLGGDEAGRRHLLHGRAPARRRPRLALRQREPRADGEQHHAEHPRPRQADLVDAEEAEPVDQHSHRELSRDQEADRPRRPEPRRADRDREDDEDSHPAAADPVPPWRPGRVAEPADSLPEHEQQRRGEERREGEVRDERLVRPDPLPEAAHHRHLDRAADPRHQGECGERCSRVAHQSEGIRSGRPEERSFR